MTRVLTVVLLGSIVQGPPPANWQDDFPPQDQWVAARILRDYAQLDAVARFERAPDEVETVRALSAVEDHARLLTSLRLIVDQHPHRMPEAFELARDSLRELEGEPAQTTQHRESLLQIVALARLRLHELSVEDAARVELVFIRLENVFSKDPSSRPPRLLEFVDRYKGTEAALMAELDLLARYGSQEQIEALDAFIARHPGTIAAARALYEKGFEYNTSAYGDERTADPLPRFERIEAIVRELQSERYPDSEWTRRAPDLIAGFHISDDAAISPTSLEGLIAAYESLGRDRFERALSSSEPAQSVVTSNLMDLYARRGDPGAQREYFFSTLASSPGAATAVEALRASQYSQALNRETPEQQKARIAKATASLRAVSGAGDSAFHRRALATLAALQLKEDGCDAAMPTLREYVTRYPRTSWSWAAHMRIARCEDVGGDMHAAIASNRHAAAAGAGVAPVRALGHATAAGLLEITGRIETALHEYRQAFDAWDSRFRDTLLVSFTRARSPGEPFTVGTDAAVVSTGWLSQRISALTEALSTPGGPLLAQARALLARDRFEEAGAVAGRMLTEHPTSPLTAEARDITRTTRLRSALGLARASSSADRVRVEQVLDDLINGPFDFAVVAARIARATLRWERGVEPEAQEQEVRAALADWQDLQPLREKLTDLEEDVAGIREAVFRPHGGGVYDSYWGRFPWPDESTPFFIVNTELSVTAADGESRVLKLPHRMSETRGVLFFDSEQLDLLARLPRTLLRQVFPKRDGDWTRWGLEAYPLTTSIAFTNAERTTATADVMIADTWATVELEKRGGKWVALRVVDFHIA